MKERADQGGLFGVEDFPAGEAVADEFVFVEGPDDLAVFVEFDDLGVLVTGVTVADDDVPVRELLEIGGPGEFDVGAGDLFGHFPDDFLVGGDFENGVAAAGGDEGVSALEANGTEDAGVGGVFPDDLTGGVVFGDDAGLFGAGEIVAVGEDLKHAGLMAPVFGEGDFFLDFAIFVEVNDASDAALGDHGVAVCEALKGVDVGTLGIVFPDDLFIGSDLGSD